MSGQLDWSQDKRSINLRVAVGPTSLRKIDVFLSDLVVKVNIQEKKFLKTLDLHAEIDYLHNENLTMYDRGTLELFLIKKEPATWPDILTKNLTKEQLIKRREASLKRKEESEQQAEIQKEDRRVGRTHRLTSHNHHQTRTR